MDDQECYQLLDKDGISDDIGVPTGTPSLLYAARGSFEAGCWDNLELVDRIGRVYRVSEARLETRAPATKWWQRLVTTSRQAVREWVGKHSHPRTAPTKQIGEGHAQEGQRQNQPCP